MRAASLCLGFALTLTTLSAGATPPIFRELVDRERKAYVAPLRPSKPLSATTALDCAHATHEISLNPATGAATATIALRAQALGKRLGSVAFAFDAGLTVQDVTVSGRTATVVDDVGSPTRIAVVHLEPPIEPGAEAVVTMRYGGTVGCKRSEEGTLNCKKSADFSYFAHQSIFPYIFDPEADADYVHDGLTRDIILSVPSGLDVVATGEKVSETIEGDRKVSRWSIGNPLARTLGIYAFIGRLGLMPIAGRLVPTTLTFPTPEKAIDRELAGWSGPVLDFVEKASGAKLPFERSLSLVRLPQALGDPGTATFGMTLLSDSYAGAGDLMYEETWAHENSHLFWGVVVPETDPRESRLMSEGIATLLEIDYTYQHHFASEDRELYLARRFLPIGLDLRADGDLVPVQLPPGSSTADDYAVSRYTLWAYYKTAAVLDHLRATVGDDLFASALTTYLERCRFVGCRPDALRQIVEEKSGKDLRPFFARWVTADENPRVLVGFTPVPGGADVEITMPDDRPMSLDVWLTLADGKRTTRRVDLAKATTRLHVDTPAPVVAVALNPRHDLMVDGRSAVEGDLDFDGETDGFDVLHCARLVGRKYETNQAGLWNTNETFDPRCDVNNDLRIDDDDLLAVTNQFGKLRAR